MSNHTPDSPTRRFNTLSDSSPHRGIAIAVLAFIGILVVGGAVLLLSSGGGSNGDQPSAPAAALTGTEQQATETLPPDPTPTVNSGQTQSNAPAPTKPNPPTQQPTEIPTDEPAAEPTEEPVTDEPEPTNPPDEPEPTEVPTQPETPDFVEPVMGDYGTLPEGLLPSGGVSTVLKLEYQLGMSLESLPYEATAYLIEWPIYSYEDVLAATERLGFFGEPQELGVGIFNVDSDRGSLFVSPNEIVFTATSFSTSSELPDDATAVDSAATWLILSGFVGPDMDSGVVVDRDEERGNVVVVFRPISPQPNLAPNPSATVNVGPGGDVLEARIHWPVAFYGSTYGLKDPLDIWASVASGFGFLEADITSVFATGILTGTATISDYSISYTLAGLPTENQFLVPLTTFYGFARIDQTGDEIPIQVTVPAIYHQISSVG